MTVVGEAIEIHETLLLAVHTHSCEDAVTLITRVSPDSGTVKSFRSSWNLQFVPWLTVKVCPAIVIDPLRAFVGLEATTKVTDPFPVPAAPDVIVIHESVVAAVHVQVLPAETEMVGPFPPFGPTEYVDGLIEYAHRDGVGVGLGEGLGAGPGVGPVGVVPGADCVMSID